MPKGSVNFTAYQSQPVDTTNAVSVLRSIGELLVEIEKQAGEGGTVDYSTLDLSTSIEEIDDRSLISYSKPLQYTAITARAKVSRPVIVK